MLVETTLVMILGILVVCFLVGSMFIYIGLYQHYRYIQYLEHEINQLFFRVHHVLAVQQARIYNLPKTHEFAFHTKKRFFATNQFSIRWLEQCYTQLIQDTQYLTTLLGLPAQNFAKTAPRASFFRLYLIVWAIFLLGSGLIIRYWLR